MDWDHGRSQPVRRDQHAALPAAHGPQPHRYSRPLGCARDGKVWAAVLEPSFQIFDGNGWTVGPPSCSDFGAESILEDARGFIWSAGGCAFVRRFLRSAGACHGGRQESFVCIRTTAAGSGWVDATPPSGSTPPRPAERRQGRRPERERGARHPGGPGPGHLVRHEPRFVPRRQHVDPVDSTSRRRSLRRRECSVSKTATGTCGSAPTASEWRFSIGIAIVDRPLRRVGRPRPEATFARSSRTRSGTCGSPPMEA